MVQKLCWAPVKFLCVVKTESSWACMWSIRAGSECSAGCILQKQTVQVCLQLPFDPQSPSQNLPFDFSYVYDKKTAFLDSCIYIYKYISLNISDKYRLWSGFMWNKMLNKTCDDSSSIDSYFFFFFCPGR